MKPIKDKSSSMLTNIGYLLAWLAAVLAAVSAVAGLLVPGLYLDSEGWVRQARAADFVTLIAVVPVLGICLLRGMTGKGRLIGLAALGYLVYTYAIFGFSVAINALTPVHFAVLGLSVWSVALYVVKLARDGEHSMVATRLPRRVTAIFLVAVAALFGVMWLSQIADVIVSGEPTAELAGLGLFTNPVYTLDLAFALPLLAVAGVLLIRGWWRAADLALVAVGWVALMGLGVLAIFGFDAAAGVPVPIAVAGVIGAITAAGTVLAILGLMPTRRGPAGAARRPLASALTPRSS